MVFGEGAYSHINYVNFSLYANLKKIPSLQKLKTFPKFKCSNLPIGLSIQKCILKLVMSSTKHLLQIILDLIQYNNIIDLFANLFLHKCL